ncbi:uncharacterized protein ACO6RY_14342 [Pungitius sinensis]
MACQAPGDHQGQVERLGKKVPVGTLVMRDLEENLDRLGQREIVEDLASATLDQEEHRVKKEIPGIVGLAAAEGAAGKVGLLEIKEFPETMVCQDLRVSQAEEGKEETLAGMEVLALRVIPASLNVML